MLVLKISILFLARYNYEKVRNIALNVNKKYMLLFKQRLVTQSSSHILFMFMLKNSFNFNFYVFIGNVAFTFYKVFDPSTSQ